MDCVRPRWVKNPKTKKLVFAPCGHCIACRLRKTSEWKLRLMMENEEHKNSAFITLTYDEDHIRTTTCGHQTLWPDDLKNFWKRLRTSLSRLSPLPSPIKYFACGEYGGEKGRPHYHAVVFGTDFTERGNWWIHHRKPDGSPVFTSDFLIDLWPFGLPTVDVVNPERCGYVAGYVQKKLFYDPWDYYREYGCCVHPFQRQSEGIGLKYYEKNQDFFLYIAEGHRPRLQGVSRSLPRYFVKKDRRMKCVMDYERLQSASEILEARWKSIQEGYSGYSHQRERELKARSARRRGK